ncbi:MAG: OsmC family protein [Gemmatimonadetes bacterium]|nr:OsmC family protein [Gemmatimonadota bacterium]
MKHDRPGSAADVRADLRVGLHWKEQLQFATGPAGVAPHVLDGNTKVAPSPPQVLLEALAGCVSVDVVLILEKQRTPAASISCDITAERADGKPRRIVKVHLHYMIAGEGITYDKAMRAIELSVTKYCTVRDTLDPEMPVTWSLDLSGEVRGSRAVALEEVPG